MATKKAKSGKKATSKAKATTKPKAAAAKKTAKKPVKKAKSLLGRLAQVSAQLVIDSGVLGKPPKRSSKRAPAKKRPRKV